MTINLKTNGNFPRAATTSQINQIRTDLGVNDAQLIALVQQYSIPTPPVTISGSSTVGSSLSASIASHWDNSSGGHWTRNGTNISSATSLNYTTVDIDGGTSLTYKSATIPYIPEAILIDESDNPVRRVIFDSDMCSDCDDVGALRIVTWAHSKGLINLLGVVISTTDAGQVPFVSAMLVDGEVDAPISGNPEIPITGICNYASIADDFPHDVDSNIGLPNSTVLYRTLLAASPTRVDIIATGFATNLSALLDSSADDISSMTGLELVTAKVGNVFLMGGDSTGIAEFNWSTNSAAKAGAANVLANWPLDIYNCDYNDGVFSSFIDLTIDPGLTDIVAAAYNADGHSTGRNSWDPFTAFVGVAPSIAVAGVTAQPVTITFNATTGVATYTNTGTSNRYLIVKSEFDYQYQFAIDNILTPSRQPDIWIEVPPVSSIEVEPVGQLLSNGAFNNSTAGWTGVRGTLSSTGGQLINTPTAGYNGAYASFTTVIGQTYQILVTVASYAGWASSTYFHILAKNGSDDSGTDLVDTHANSPDCIRATFTAIGTTSALFIFSEDATGRLWAVDRCWVRHT